MVSGSTKGKQKRVLTISLTCSFRAQVHAEQMRHARKGCLTRPVQDVPSDGSRIEGSHKGWNSLMRSYTSGLENMLYLCSDFVLRRNIRAAIRAGDGRPFAASTYGSHHIGYVNFVNRFWNELVQSRKGVPKGAEYTLSPVLAQILSDESFGIVSSESASTFGGLFAVKQEEEDAIDDMRLHGELPSEDEILQRMNIDPHLRQQPLATSNSVSTSPSIPSSLACAASTGSVTNLHPVTHAAENFDKDNIIVSNPYRLLPQW